MAKEEFKIHELVEVPRWTSPVGKNWVIVGFASNGTEACLRRCTDSDVRVFVPLSDLKHQKERVENTQSVVQPELDEKAKLVRQEVLTWVLDRLEKGLADANFDDNVGCIQRLQRDIRIELGLPGALCTKDMRDGYREVCRQVCDEKQRTICRSKDV